MVVQKVLVPTFHKLLKEKEKEVRKEKCTPFLMRTVVLGGIAMLRVGNMKLKLQLGRVKKLMSWFWLVWLRARRLLSVMFVKMSPIRV